MQQPGILLFWLPAAIAGLVALAAAAVVIWFYQNRWNRLARDRQALLNEIASLEEDKLRLRAKLDSAAPPEESEPPTDDAPDLPDDPDSALPPPAFASTRFPLLTKMDEKYAQPESGTADSPPAGALQYLAEHLRRYAAAHCGIYAPPGLYGSFLGAMAVSDLLLLRGEDSPPAAAGVTGHPAMGLASAVAQAMGRELDMVTVQAHWRGSADLLGRCGAATKIYEETHFLRLLYEAGLRKGPSLVAFQRFMAAPPERWMAELLPLLELRTPSRKDEWIRTDERRSLRLAESSWPNDPRLLREGSLPWPEGVWLLGLLGADDPAPPPRLREIAMEFTVPAQAVKPFLVPWTQPLPMETAHLRGLFDHAAELYKLPLQMRGRWDALEEYLAAQLQLNLGARSGERLERFAATCLACGMTSRDAVDSYLWHHALRKLDTLEPAALRHLLPGLSDFMVKTFERRSVPMAMEYLRGLGKEAA